MQKSGGNSGRSGCLALHRRISGILWLMNFTHHGLQIELLGDWWTEAGMHGFAPTFTAYRVNQKLFPNVREVPITDVGPVIRNPGVGIFNDSIDEGFSARERSCESCAASGLTTLFRPWKSSQANPVIRIDISWFMLRTASIVRWLPDSSAYLSSKNDKDGTHQRLKAAPDSNFSSFAVGQFQPRLLRQFFRLEILRQNDEFATFIFVKHPTFR